MLTNVGLPETADFELGRIDIVPGGSGFAGLLRQPQQALIIMESGTLTIRMKGEAWQISRAAAVSDALFGDNEAPDVSPLTKTVPMGDEAILRPGDVAHLTLTVDADVRNLGDEPAIALVVVIEPSPMEAMVGGLLPVATPAE